jgi:hypothetical protein
MNTCCAVNPHTVFAGSNADETKALYDDLETLGPVGIIALNLFRACKCSGRAKLYHRRAHKTEAYARKQWSMDNLAKVLDQHPLFTWGWKEDPKQDYHRWVLYCDIPTGQVSFHTAHRGIGPDYPVDWDGVADASRIRICTWCQALLEGHPIVDCTPALLPGGDPTPKVLVPCSHPSVRYRSSDGVEYCTHCGLTLL